MKKIILFSIILIFILITSFLISVMVKKLQTEKVIAEKITRLPDFSFLTLNNEVSNSKDIREGPVLVVHFHPECEYCQYEISEILKSKIPTEFKNVILISSAHPDSIKNFLSRFNYSEFSSVIPLIDTAYSFEDIFGRGVIPSSYIYDRNLNLLKVLHGEVKTETVLKFIH
jgi:thiol-disulfide isomerase/thioredoxin